MFRIRRLERGYTPGRFAKDARRLTTGDQHFEIRMDAGSLLQHLAVRRRLAEFWADSPAPDMIAASRLEGNSLLCAPPAPTVDKACLTAKEILLLRYFQAHPAEVCEKDDLIRAVWPEDRIFIKGIRDDSLAQLVRRLREKVETAPSAPRLIHTVPGRGYRFTPE